MAEALIQIEVAYAKPTAQVLVALQLPVGATVQQAIERAGILQQYPEIDLAIQKVGIFSQVCCLQQVLQENDRVEIYRPLLQDPKEARRNRALKP
jgi:uncharacterized protein